MPLDLFRNKHVRHLRTNIVANLSHYVERKPWADKPSVGGPGRLACTLKPVNPLELELPEGEDRKDLENSILIHQAFPSLSPVQARDPRLWTRLAHIECWNYMRKRWDAARHMDDSAKAERYILAHYFIPRAESRSLLRNGIARLWWYAHLTHDAERDNPYELTGVLLSYLDIAQQLLERNMGRASEVRTGFLEVLLEHDTELGATSEQKRQRIRELAKLLNLRGGVTLLDTLSKDQVSEILEEELGLEAA